jgi:antitoxin component YwqK of YwqJK toxin-antitoxin module
MKILKINFLNFICFSLLLSCSVNETKKRIKNKCKGNYCVYLIDTTVYKNGRIESIIPRLKNGDIHGVETWYFENGQIAYQQEYFGGKKLEVKSFTINQGK